LRGLQNAFSFREVGFGFSLIALRFLDFAWRRRRDRRGRSIA
jgi:hypothetical protein